MVKECVAEEGEAIFYFYFGWVQALERVTRFVEGSASDILTVKEAEIVFHKVRLRIAIASCG